MAKKKKTKRQKWDDHLVIAVMVVAAVCILIMLASYISSTGKAYSGLPATEDFAEILNQAELIEGSGRMKCTYACGKVGGYAISSSFDGASVENTQIQSGSYTCLCAIN
ncbi:MAG: hypothetical protein ABIG93_01195 [archaeon]|nr:hypothetical protein [Nanoarchaeota archaeon]